MISMKTFSFVKRIRSASYIDSGWVIWIVKMSFASLVRASQSSLTVHSCLSPSSLGTLTNFQLRPSATTLRRPGLWRTSTMLWAMTASRHRACVEFSVELRRWSRSAWQSVLSSIGYPHIISENLSKLCFRAPNSSMNGLYFSSVVEVCLDANPIGWAVVLSVPFGRIVVNFWVSIPANPYLQPSVVTMNGVPSYFGPFSTGSLVNATFSLRKAWSCSHFHKPSSANPFIARVYAAFPFCLGISRLHAKSVSGCAIDAYPFIR